MTTKPINRDYFNALNPVALFYGDIVSYIKAVGAEELKGMLDRKEGVVLLNVLGRDEFEKERIPGSINIPVAEIEKEAPGLAKKMDTVVVYSSGQSATSSAVGADKLITLGFKNVLRFPGGLEEWVRAGYKVESS